MAPPATVSASFQVVKPTCAPPMPPVKPGPTQVSPSVPQQSPPGSGVVAVVHSAAQLSAPGHLVTATPTASFKCESASPVSMVAVTGAVPCAHRATTSLGELRI